MDRIKEPSTWAGIAAILAVVSPMAETVSPTAGWFVSGAAAFAGGLAVKLREFPAK